MSLYFKAFCRHYYYNRTMKSAIKKQQNTSSYAGLDASQLLAILAEKDESLQLHIECKIFHCLGTDLPVMCSYSDRF